MLYTWYGAWPGWRQREAGAINPNRVDFAVRRSPSRALHRRGLLTAGMQGPLFFCQHKPMVRAVSLHASDFQRALGSRPVSRTAHFVLHALPPQLSTGSPVAAPVLVDDSGLPVWRLGLVLPKKQARRSVTRSLIRHQARDALSRYTGAVVQGTPAAAQAVDGWVLRLRSPFERSQYPSAASDALKAAVRLELDELWGRLAQGGWRLPAPSPAAPGRKAVALSAEPTVPASP